jgi:hypothetical protein
MPMAFLIPQLHLKDGNATLELLDLGLAVMALTHEGLFGCRVVFQLTTPLAQHLGPLAQHLGRDAYLTSHVTGTVPAICNQAHGVGFELAVILTTHFFCFSVFAFIICSSCSLALLFVAILLGQIQARLPQKLRSRPGFGSAQP